MNCDLNKCPYNVKAPSGAFCGDSKFNFPNPQICPNPKEKAAAEKDSATDFVQHPQAAIKTAAVL
jgi:hypothetical protein